MTQHPAPGSDRGSVPGPVPGIDPGTVPGPDIWAVVGELVGWLDERNGSGPQETALRLLKLTEESGEVAQAYLGMTGQNPRKGTTHTSADVAGELCDVIVSAMVALHSFTDRPARLFTDRLGAIERRSRAFHESE